MKRIFATTFFGLLALSGLASSLSFASRGLYMPLSQELQFPYTSEGVSNIEVTVSKCYVNNLNAYRLDSYDHRSRARVIAQKHLTLDPPYDKSTTRMLKVSELMGDAGPGFYLLAIKTELAANTGSSSTEWHYVPNDDCLFALTDLGLSATVAPVRGQAEVIALVHSLTSGKPLADAQVTVFSHANQVIGEGTTDAQGIVRVTLNSAFLPDEDTVSGILATRGKDVSFLALDRRSSLHPRANDSQAELEDVRAFLFAERDICRPGEAFDTGLFLRSSPQGGQALAAGAPVELALYDPDDELVESRRLRTDAWGFIPATWKLPAAAQVGYWKVVAKLADREIGNFSVNVSAYVPDRFRVTIAANESAKPPTFNGTAVYYFGENVREGEYKISAHAGRASAAPHWEGWTVGLDEVPDGLDYSEEGDVEDGVFSGAYPEDLYEKILAAKAPVVLGFSAEVTPPGARTVTARGAIRIDPTPDYIGVREAETAVRGNRAFELAYLPARKGGPVTSTGDISIKVIRREWMRHAVELSYGGYRMEWREERTEMTNLACRVKTGRVEFASALLPAGAYTLVASTEKQETRLDFWHWEGDLSERSASPAALHITGGAEKTAPGEIVQLAFDSGYEGLAYVAAGERGIEETQSFAVKKGRNAFAVKVRPDAVGAFYYASVTVVAENAPKVRRLSGLARIPVDQAAKRYPVKMTLPEVAKPGSTVKVTLKADKPGAVRIMAVDEGVLALTDYETPDAYAYFHAYDFGCPFGVYDLYSLIYPDLKILPNGQIGGGSSVGAMKRQNVRTRRDSTLKERETARVVLPLVEIPASGEATAEMTLPDFTGALKVMAVAVDETRSGGDEATLIVRDAASLFINVPRVVTGGDMFEVVAEVFNHDLPDSDWRLEIDGHVYAGRVTKGGSTNVAFRVTVPEAATGLQTVKGTLTVGGETFRDTVQYTVRPKTPPMTEIVWKYLPEGSSQSLAAVNSNDWIRLDETDMLSYGDPRAAVNCALAWLLKYPYGCLEQTTAMAFPFLATAHLEKLGLLDAAAASNAVVKIKAAYGELMQMSRGDGSFSMWPDGGETWSDGSLFALHFIFAAERRGYVKPDPRGQMIRYLRRQADGNDSSDRVNRAYAAYILALAGEEAFVAIAKNVLATPQDDFAAFLASAALIRGGYRADGEVAFRKALEARVWDTAKLPASVCWSRIRAYGMTLQIVSDTLVDANTLKTVEPLVGKLLMALRSDDSAWGTTRDNAWAAAGLAAFSAVSPQKGTFVCRIASGIPKKPVARPRSIRVERTFPKKVKRGELVDVVIKLQSAHHVPTAVLCDLIPGGFEIEDSALKTRAADNGKKENAGRSEIRDDRWLWFGSIFKRESAKDEPLTLRYRLRAVSRGTFAVPTLSVESMYDPDVAGCVEPSGTVVVE